MHIGLTCSKSTVVVVEDPGSSHDLREVMRANNQACTDFVVVYSGTDDAPVMQDILAQGTNLHPRARNIHLVHASALEQFMQFQYADSPAVRDDSAQDRKTALKVIRVDGASLSGAVVGSIPLGGVRREPAQPPPLFHGFLISMTRRKDRLRFMLRKLSSVRMNASLEVCVGFDGLKNRNMNNTGMNNGAFGLYMTYKRLLKHCMDQQLERVLILEDDVYFHRDFSRRVASREFRDLVTRHNVVYIGHNQTMMTTEQVRDATKGFFRLSDQVYTYGTFGIVLDSTAVRALYREIVQDMQPVDICLYNCARGAGLRNAVLYPPLVVPEVRESDNMGSRDMDLFLKDRGLYSIKHLYRDVHLFSSYIKGNDRVASTFFERSDTMFVFVVASYNNADWVERNISSIVNQTYTKWRVVYIDDASTDKTYDAVRRIVREKNVEKKFTILRHTDRTYQAYSRWVAYTACADDEVCVLLDGDDWLYTAYALAHLDKLYRSSGVLVTYGQFVYWDNGEVLSRAGHKEFPDDVRRNKTYRQHEWISSHLRTARARVLKTIQKHEIRDHTGRYYKICTDMVEMFFALERCYGRHRNSGMVLCVYNQQNSKRHPLSFYNRHSHMLYREQVESHIRTLR